MQVAPRLSAREKILLLLGLLLVVAIALYLFALAPLRQKILTVENDVAVMEGKLMMAKSLAARRDELEAAIQDVVSDMEALAATMPASRGEPAFLMYVEEHADALDLLVWHVNLESVRREGLYHKWPITLLILGPFPGQLAFIQALEDMTRLVSFSSVAFSTDSSTGLLLGTYRLSLFMDPAGQDPPWDPGFGPAGRTDPFRRPH